MTNLEVIRKLKDSTFIDEDGEAYHLEFQDGLSDSTIEQLRERFPNKTIANEIIEILKETRGWDGYGPGAIYFDAVNEFGFQALSPNSITLGHDGFGNFWILDLKEDGSLGQVFFACHDPAVFVIHSQTLNEYLRHLLEFYGHPSDSHLDEIHDETVFTIWDENHLCCPKSEFERNNPEFKHFLEKFSGDEWTIADLRKGENKDGFAWGKFGANQFIERHPTELIWVIKNKERGILDKLFGWK